MARLKLNKITGHLDKLMNALLGDELPGGIVKSNLFSHEEQKKQLEERLEALITELTEADITCSLPFSTMIIK
ncbi:hypothetical protein V6Z54_07745 [Bacillus sp. MAG717A]|uniref:hypothetical protein n=1 Tax=Bacillus sp. MAG717A TaxID=3122078 RepID=UPI0030D29122